MHACQWKAAQVHNIPMHECFYIFKACKLNAFCIMHCVTNLRLHACQQKAAKVQNIPMHARFCTCTFSKHANLMHFVSCMLSGKYVTNSRLHACQQKAAKGHYVTLCACKFSCVSESLFAHQIHLPCLCLVLMSYYHCTSRLGSREVQWSPYRSPAQARAAGHESASTTLLLYRMEDQGLQLGGQGATVQLTCQPVSQRRRRRAG